MDVSILYEDDHFLLTRDQNDVLIQLRHEGLTMKDLQSVLQRIPRIELKNFSALQQAFSHFAGEPVKFGVWRPLVDCTVSADGMEAKIRIFEIQEELDKQPDILSDILKALESKGVREGILMDAIRGPYVSQSWVVVARGIPPIKGENAIVKYFSPSEKKPQLKSDGKTDFYEMNFIDEVHCGDWLGEKTPPTTGIFGRTVTGKPLPAMNGRDQILRYDPKTVTSVEEEGRTILRAAVDGAVEWKEGRISVTDRLTISGDVGVATGNIEFSGAVVIHGTVQDTFSVIAGRDLSILSPLGIGAVGRIVSKNGDIYIRGGIHGQGKATIEAKGNIYAKHANNCVMRAGNEIHIGYYAMGCDIRAKVIALDKDKGRLIGGNVVAESQVVAAYIGNMYERQTEISVEGFNRDSVKEALEALVNEHQSKIKELEKVMRILDSYETATEPLDKSAKAEYESALLTRQHLETDLHLLDNSIKARAAILKTRGEGEVSIAKAAYPKTHLSIKSRRQIVSKETKGTFFISEDTIHFE